MVSSADLDKLFPPYLYMLAYQTMLGKEPGEIYTLIAQARSAKAAQRMVDYTDGQWIDVNDVVDRTNMLEFFEILFSTLQEVL
jgi:hypothetical protein